MDMGEEEEEGGDGPAGPGQRGVRGRGGGSRGQLAVREGARRGKAKAGGRQQQQQQPEQRWEDPEVFVIEDSSCGSGCSGGSGGEEEDVGAAQGASGSEGGAHGMDDAWDAPPAAPHVGVLRPPADSPAQSPQVGSLGDDPWVGLGFERGPGVLGGSGGWEPHPQVPGLWQPAAVAAAAAAAEGAGEDVDTQATPPPAAGRRGLDAARSGPIIYGTPSTCDTDSAGRRLYGRGTGAEEEPDAGSAGGGVTAGLQALCCDTRATSPPPGGLEAAGRGGLAGGARSGQGGEAALGLGPGEGQQELAGSVGEDTAVDSPGEGLAVGAATGAGRGVRREGGEAGIGVERRGNRPAALRPPRAPTPSEVVDLCSPLPLSVRLGARRGPTADCPAGAPAGSAAGAAGTAAAACERNGGEQGLSQGQGRGQGHGPCKRHRSPRPQAPLAVGDGRGEGGLAGGIEQMDEGGGTVGSGARADGGVDVGWSVSPWPLRRRHGREGVDGGQDAGACGGVGGGQGSEGATWGEALGQGQEGDGSEDSDVIIIC